jgi:hypothetical protein
MIEHIGVSVVSRLGLARMYSNSAKSSVTLTNVFLGFTQSVETSTGITLANRPLLFLSRYSLVRSRNVVQSRVNIISFFGQEPLHLNNKL